MAIPKIIMKHELELKQLQLVFLYKIIGWQNPENDNYYAAISLQQTGARIENASHLDTIQEVDQHDFKQN